MEKIVYVVEVVDSAGRVVFQESYDRERQALSSLSDFQINGVGYPLHGRASVYEMRRILIHEF